jgi:Methyltransferase domain
MVAVFAGCHEALQRVLAAPAPKLSQTGGGTMLGNSLNEAASGTLANWEALRGPTNRFLRFAAPGHVYSPIPDENVVERSELFSSMRPVMGMDFNEDVQLRLLEELRLAFSRFPYRQDSVESSGLLRYTLDNPFICPADAITLFAFLLRFKPSSIIEVGSGYSSALMLDTAERFLERRPRMLFIEPHPERLKMLFRDGDLDTCEVVETRVESVPLRVFERLCPSDILFIDSSHVGKLGSDVLFLLFEVIPRLREGVISHFHDIFWPFEYPRE